MDSYDYSFDDIAIYCVKIDDVAECMDMSEFSDHRKERILSIKKDEAKKQSVAAEIALISAMRKYAPHILPPFQYKVGEHGKPYFEEIRDIYFSISHSGEYSVCAVSDAPIGIDIQIVNSANENIAKRWYNEHEQEAAVIPDEFARIWARKEAVAKADGRGLGIGIKDIDTFKDKIRCDEMEYRIYDIPAPEGYMIAVAKAS